MAVTLVLYMVCVWSAMQVLHTVISCDTDGGLCTWRVGLNDLSVPSQRWKMQLNTLTSPPFSTGVLQGTFLPLSHSSAPANTLFRSAPSPTVGAGLLTGGGDYVPSLGLTCISHSSAHRDYARSLFFELRMVTCVVRIYQFGTTTISCAFLLTLRISAAWSVIQVLRILFAICCSRRHLIGR